MLLVNCKAGRLGRRRWTGSFIRGGSSKDGDGAKRGETEKFEPLSETSDGGPSSEPALDISDAAGDGRESPEGRRKGEYEGDMASAHVSL